MTERAEHYEITFDILDRTITLSASSSTGRLTIRSADRDSTDCECCLTVADTEELAPFFTELRRLLGAAYERSAAPDERRDTDETEPPNLPPPVFDRPPDERDTIIELARRTNPNAFAPWSREEEEDVLCRYETGEPIEEIARHHNRSPRAIALRLKRIGAQIAGEEDYSDLVAPLPDIRVNSR